MIAGARSVTPPTIPSARTPPLPLRLRGDVPLRGDLPPQGAGPGQASSQRTPLPQGAGPGEASSRTHPLRNWGRAIGTPNKDLLTISMSHAYLALVDELLHVRTQRHLRRRHEIAIERRSIHASRQVAGGASSPSDFSEHLGLTLETMETVLLELAHGIADRVPVPGEEHPGLQGLQPFQGVDVGSHVTFRISDHRASAPENEVTCEHRAILSHPEAKVVGAVAGRVQGGHVEPAGSNH